MNIASSSDSERLALYEKLHELFSAYHLLTGQLREAVLAAETEKLFELIDLRQETMARIEGLQASAEEAFALPFEEETDPAVKALRQALRLLAAECQSKEEGLAQRFAKLHEQLRAEARQVNLTQRRVNGYTRQLSTPSRYIEDRK